MFDAGRFPGDEIARVVAGYGFCDDCKAACRGKIICIEVDTPEQTGNPPLQKEAPLNRVSPTGRWVTLTTQEVKETPFPPGVMALVYITTPAYISLLFTEKMGNLMLAACAFWMSVGIFVMRKMINFKT